MIIDAGVGDKENAKFAEIYGLDRARPIVFVTAHRRENHGSMRDIARAIVTIAGFPERPQILWPVHPSPAVWPVVHEIAGATPGVRLVEPMNYAETVAAVAASRFVLTDSGGLQEEAPTLGTRAGEQPVHGGNQPDEFDVLGKRSGALLLAGNAYGAAGALIPRAGGEPGADLDLVLSRDDLCCDGKTSGALMPAKLAVGTAA